MNNLFLLNKAPHFNKKQQGFAIQKVLMPFAALILLLGVVAWFAGFLDEKVAPSLSVDTPKTYHDSYTVTESPRATFEPVAASINSKQDTILSSRILARIEKISVRAGDTVKKGQVLIILEQGDLNAQVLQAKQRVMAAKAREKEASQNLKRASKLFKTNLVSEYELDKTRADYLSIKADLTSAEQSLKQYQATLNYATLTAPIDGRIVDRFAEPGNTAQPGEMLLSLYNPLSLRVEAQVRERLALTLVQGQTIDVELPSVDKVIKGEIEEIVPAADTGSRSFLIKASISYNENLLPGMYARMLIPSGNDLNLLIPLNKVSHVGQLDYVWLNVNGVIQRRYVRLGKKHENSTVSVISGLKAGDILINPS